MSVSLTCKPVFYKIASKITSHCHIYSLCLYVAKRLPGYTRGDTDGKSSETRYSLDNDDVRRYGAQRKQNWTTIRLVKTILQKPNVKWFHFISNSSLQVKSFPTFSCFNNLWFVHQNAPMHAQICLSSTRKHVRYNHFSQKMYPNHRV